MRSWQQLSCSSSVYCPVGPRLFLTSYSGPSCSNPFCIYFYRGSSSGSKCRFCFDCLVGGFFFFLLYLAIKETTMTSVMIL